MLKCGRPVRRAGTSGVNLARQQTYLVGNKSKRELRIIYYAEQGIRNALRQAGVARCKPLAGFVH